MTYTYCLDCGKRCPPFENYKERYGQEREEFDGKPNPQLFCPNCGSNAFECFSRRLPE